jgi:AcrR family transcriptional regulator
MTGSTIEEAGAARRARRNLNTRRALCRAAVRLFSQHGYAATPAGAIANAADYAERTFFRHFARKEDVIFYDLPERLAALKADFAASQGRPAWAVIRTTLIANAGRWEETDHELTLARVRLFHTEPVLEARYLEICRDWEDAVAVIMAAELDVDPDSDPRCRLIAAATIGAFRAAFRAWLADPETPIAGHLATCLDHIETGILPAGPT